MSANAIFMMFIILGLVWGGFVLALRAAMKKESQKGQSNDR